MRHPARPTTTPPSPAIDCAVVVRDEFGRVLLCQPSDSAVWDLPTVTRRPDESPTDTARRAVLRFLGVERAIGNVLVVDWVPTTGRRREHFVLVMDGGVPPVTWTAGFATKPEITRDWAWCGLADVMERARSRVVRRVRSSVGMAVARGGASTLTNGSPEPGAYGDETIHYMSGWSRHDG